MTRILNCDNDECPKDWEKLPLAGETHIGVCTVCLKAVYRCESEEEAQLREQDRPKMTPEQLEIINERLKASGLPQVQIK